MKNKPVKTALIINKLRRYNEILKELPYIYKFLPYSHSIYKFILKVSNTFQTTDMGEH